AGGGGRDTSGVHWRAPARRPGGPSCERSLTAMTGGQGKVIITAAITGGVHVPAQSPHLPITPDQIVEEVARAHEAGAAVAHVHVRDPQTGQPTPRLDLFRQVAELVKARCSVVLW